MLEKFIKFHKLLPKKFGITIILNYVLISPKSVIKGPSRKKFDSSNVIKADTLNTVIENSVEELSIFKCVSVGSKIVPLSVIEEFGKKLIKFHVPSKIDLERKFGITRKFKEKVSLYNVKNIKNYFCAKCKKNISEKKQNFARIIKIYLMAGLTRRFIKTMHRRKRVIAAPSHTLWLN